MPSESPTRIRSIPASATRRALGKSYAVSIASRAPFLPFSSRTVGFMAQACEIEQLAVEQVRRAHVGERAHDRLDAAGVEQVEKKGGEDVVAVMAERDLGRAELAGSPVQRPASQARAERAHRLALGDHALHHRVGVLLDDAIGYAAAFEILGQHAGGEAGLLLVQIYRNYLEGDRRLDS